MTFSVENKTCRIGEGTREIGYRDIHSIMTAYEIEEIVLPESLQVIGDEAFFRLAGIETDPDPCRGAPYWCPSFLGSGKAGRTEGSRDRFLCGETRVL